MAGDGDWLLHRAADTKSFEGLDERGDQTRFAGNSESGDRETALERARRGGHLHHDCGTSSSTRTFQRSSPTVNSAKYFCVTCSRCTTELPSRYSISSCAVSRTCNAEPSGE